MTRLVPLQLLHSRRSPSILAMIIAAHSSWPVAWQVSLTSATSGPVFHNISIQLALPQFEVICIRTDRQPDSSLEGEKR